MDIVTVDPRDDAAFRAWYAVVEAAHDELWPGQPGWQFEELRARAIDPGPAVRLELYGVHDDTGRLVGSARVDMPLTDNTNRAEATIAVHPERRRLGAGTALLGKLEHRTVADDRRWLTLVHDEPSGHTAGSPGRSFAVRHGYSVAQALVRRDLSVPPWPQAGTVAQDRKPAGPR
jgi:GNAT superfamily N-acetyltransferase